ncbi:MAG TPA: adenylate/guanylate cyclase domain-containing protein [Burkholderiales bacterium]|nr:adenylate/guanylate cyclase domain-containing protein [Burkholderiales bacterium]
MEPSQDIDSTPPPPNREAAVMFAELVGAAELYARLGDAVAHDAIAPCVEKLQQTAESTKARFVKRIGGRLMLLSESADAAARTAVAMQVAAGDFPATGDTRLGLGVGFHYGPVIQNNADVFGDTVNLAARLVEQAARGQILLASETAEQVGSLYRRSIRRLYAVQLKGLEEELSLCEMVWRADEPATFYPFDAASVPVRAKLKLKYRGNKMVLRRILEAFTIGRDPGCGLVIDNEHASRHHCTIQRRHAHFVLADKSTNGTFVTVEGEEEAILHREEFTLRKSGWISFGQPRSAGGEALEFICD